MMAVSRRDALALLPACGIIGQPVAVTPMDLARAVAASYREFTTFRIFVASAASDPTSSMSVTLAVQQPVAKYIASYPAGFGQLTLWSDGKSVRSFESKQRRFFEGDASSMGGRMVIKLMRTAETRFWTRFATLDSERILSKKIQRGSLRRDGISVSCARITIAGPSAGENPSSEELWIGETSGLVLRSVTRWPIPIDRQQATDWLNVSVAELSAPDLAFDRPAGAVQVDRPAFPGK